MAAHFNRQYCGKCHATYMIAGAPLKEPVKAKKVVVAAAPEAAAAGKGGKKGKKK